MAADVLPQHVSITMPDLRAISQPAQIDPDVSATLTDFLAYTEHLPSSVIRSMTLIGEQDKLAMGLQQNIHELVTTYSCLSTSPTSGNVSIGAALRREISYAYERLERARRMAHAESRRILEMVYKDQVRLDVITHKLKTMPMPPSRDPTPEQQSSPQMKKTQPILEKRASHRLGSAPRVRGRKIMVPGEVLPPLNPDSLPPSDHSDSDSIRPSSPVIDRKRPKDSGKARTPRPQKDRKEKTPKPVRVRTPGQPGTNVHSTVAGISTSNALLALVPPPPEAVPGSKWLPWKRITEYELAKLRKRMKKNAIWLPSPAMRNRELKGLGRGQQNMELARKRAEETGEPFVDEYDQNWTDPTRAEISGEDRKDMAEFLGPEIEGGDDDELMNRGMRLNEAKKRKREKMLEEQAIQAQMEAEQNGTALPSTVVNTILEVADDINTAKPAAASKKRKRDSTPATSKPVPANVVTSPDNRQQVKKIKLSIPSASASNSNPTSAITPRSPLPPRSPKPRSRNVSAIPDTLTTPVEDRKPTRITLKPNKAASAEPPNRRNTLRRGSGASLPGSAARAGSVDSRTEVAQQQQQQQQQVEEVVGRGGRRKKPAPGLITADEDGRVKGAVGKRKAAPRKKARRSDLVMKSEEEVKEEPEEPIDPDEPRYCICGDVSWGTMVACENMNCPIEWFHLSCVDLHEMPPRLAKWYCPECRKGNPERGSGTNGIVRRGK